MPLTAPSIDCLIRTCPSCQATLRLPAAAAGQRARCPSCRHVFEVLHHNDLEDLISDWIQEDVEDMWSQRDEKARAVAEAQKKKREAERAEQAQRDSMVLRAVQRPRTPLDVRPDTPEPVRPAVRTPTPERLRANHGVHQPRHMPVG